MTTFEDRLKVLTCKIEADYATDPVPTGSANAILGSNFRFQSMQGTDVPRALERPYLGAQQQLLTALHAMISFETELVGHGTAGTAPAWGVLARACGLAQTIDSGVSVTYNPISKDFESATFYFYHEGKLFKLRGARGTAVLRINADGIPVIAWTFTGLWDAPTDTAMASPVFTAWNEPQVVNKTNTPTFTLNAVAQVMRSFEFNLGNQVAFRSLVGFEEVRIGDRAESITTQVDAVSLASFNPFTLARNQTAFALSLVHGVGAGKIVTLAAPSCRMQRPGDTTAPNGIVERSFNITPLPVSGNDQFTLTLT